MSEFFTVSTDTQAQARHGALRTRAGIVNTPAFMPVGTRGTVKSVTADLLATTGAEIMLCNTYHMHMAPGEAVVKALGGLHEFTRWKLPILTDSGGFQVFSLAHTRKVTEEGVHFKDPKSGEAIFISPESSIQTQLDLGSDIIMAFDDLTGLDETSIGRTKEAFERTHRWLERSLAAFQQGTADIPSDKRPLFFGIVQGGLDKDLRRQSLERVQALPVDGIAIGGLSVGEPRADMHEMLAYLAPYYDPNRPRYLMGVGDPVDLRFAYSHGIDMADCVLPSRNGRHGVAFVTACTCESRTGEGATCTTCNGAPNERLQIKNAQFAQDARPIMEGCDCYTCSRGYSRAFLRHQFKVDEPLAGTLVSLHNIHYLIKLAQGLVVQ
jgi:queuine tRNA-ribosyltransferase